MSIDYRLLEQFETSRKRHETARLLLPERWRSDPRPEAQTINEHWVRVMVQACEHRDQRIGRSLAAAVEVGSNDHIAFEATPAGRPLGRSTAPAPPRQRARHDR